MLQIKQIIDNITKTKYILLAECGSHDTFFPMKLSLFVCHKNSVFCCDFDKEHIDKLQPNSNVPLKEYINLTQEAFADNERTENFIYEILEPENSESNLKFTWKHLHSADITVNLGSINLKQNNEYDAISVMQYIGLCMKDLQKQNSQLRKEQSVLKGRVNQLLNSLENLQISKEKFENEMYKKFVIVINNMKDKYKNIKLKMDSSLVDSDNSIPCSSTSHIKEGKTHNSDKSVKGVSYVDSDDPDNIPEPSKVKRKNPKNKSSVRPMPELSVTISKKSHHVSSSDEDSEYLMDLL